MTMQHQESNTRQTREEEADDAAWERGQCNQGERRTRMQHGERRTMPTGGGEDHDAAARGEEDKANKGRGGQCTQGERWANNAFKGRIRHRCNLGRRRQCLQGERRRRMQPGERNKTEEGDDKYEAARGEEGNAAPGKPQLCLNLFFLMCPMKVCP